MGGKNSTIAGRKPGKEKYRELVIQGKPSLSRGINLLQKPGKLPVFQSLVSNELEAGSSTAVWIDTMNEASTYALSSYGSPEIMEKVYIGRAFTPFQHHSLIHRLEDFIDEDTELIVLPSIDSLYIDGQLKEWEAEELFRETWTKILEVRERHDLKALVSLSGQKPALSYVVEGCADNRIEVDSTSEGWRYSSGDFEQYGYQERGKVQTTLPYWIREKPGLKVSVEVV